MNTVPAIWLSRHAPTASQIADANALGYRITAIPEGQQLGSLDLQDEGDVKALVAGVLALCAQHNATAIFGVFAAPLVAQIARTAAECIQRGGLAGDEVRAFSSWNVQRTSEGGKPTFTHRCWVACGHLSQSSVRWLG